MYVSVRTSEHGRESIEYAEGQGHGHNGHKIRNLLKTTINMLPGINIADQMQNRWKKARVNHKKQLLIIIVSWSSKELNPNNPKDVQTANEILKNLVKKRYPNREACIYLQADGKSELLHGHVLISDCGLDDYKATTNEQRHVAHVRKWANEEASKFIDLDNGTPATTKRTQTERAKTEKADRIRKKNKGKSEKEIQEILISERAYSYKEDLRQRILSAAQKADTEEFFLSELESNGITATKKHSKVHGDYYLYDFTAGCPIKTRNKKARSYKLGYAFSPAGINTLLSENKDHRGEKQAKTDDFTKWLIDTGQSYMTFDPNGHITSIDFEKMETLHELYESRGKKVDLDTASDTENNDDVTQKDFIELQYGPNEPNNAKTETESQRQKIHQVLKNNREDSVIRGIDELLLAERRGALAESDLNIEEPTEETKNNELEEVGP